MGRIRKAAGDTSGAMMVEMALVLPLIVLLSLGSVDLGLYAFQMNLASKASHLGARWAVVNPPVSATFVTAMNDTSWWQDGWLGKDCSQVTCRPLPVTSATSPYACYGGKAGCSMTGIGAKMRAVYSSLQDSEIRVDYQPFLSASPRALGFVGRPATAGGIPVDVVVSVCKPLNFVFLGSLFNLAKGAAPSECPGSPNGWYAASTTRLSSESFGEPP